MKHDLDKSSTALILEAIDSGASDVDLRARLRAAGVDPTSEGIREAIEELRSRPTVAKPARRRAKAQRRAEETLKREELRLEMARLQQERLGETTPRAADCKSLQWLPLEVRPVVVNMIVLGRPGSEIVAFLEECEIKVPNEAMARVYAELGAVEGLALVEFPAYARILAEQSLALRQKAARLLVRVPDQPTQLTGEGIGRSLRTMATMFSDAASIDKMLLDNTRTITSADEEQAHASRIREEVLTKLFGSNEP